MKRAGKLCLMLLAILLLLPGVTLSAVSASPDKRETAEAVWGTPVIDGVRDSVWNRAQTYGIIKVDTAVIPSHTAVTGKFSLLWDETFLYVAVTVEKHGGEVVSAFSGEENDSVEVDLTDLGIFDGTENVSDPHNPGAGGFRVGCDGALSGFGGYYLLTEKHFTAQAALLTEDSYFVEMAIPFLQLTPRDGSILSLEVQINVSDASQGRTGLVTWASQPCLGWRDSAVHGAVTLTGRETYENQTSPDTRDPFPQILLSAISAGGCVGILLLRKHKKENLRNG